MISIDPLLLNNTAFSTGYKFDSNLSDCHVVLFTMILICFSLEPYFTFSRKSATQ